MSSGTEQIALNREILTILYANDAYWGRCSGPENRPGMTFEPLLTALLDRYPTRMWNAELLNLLLNLGLRTGIFKTQQVNLATCQVQVDPPPLPQPTPFFGNNSMVIERYTNKVYTDIAPRRICIPQCHRTIAPLV